MYITRIDVDVKIIEKQTNVLLKTSLLRYEVNVYKTRLCPGYQSSKWLVVVGGEKKGAHLSRANHMRSHPYSIVEDGEGGTQDKLTVWLYCSCM